MTKKKSAAKPNIFIEIFGWYGAIAIITAYALVSFEVIIPESLTYQLLNLTGSVGILLSALQKKDYQPVFLNIVWILIAITATAMIMLH